MPKKRFSAEQIVTVLRQIEVAMAQGKSVSIACRDAGISDQSYARRAAQWRDLLQPERSTGPDRAVAAPLQHRPTALIARLSPARTANFCAADVPSRWDNGYAVTSITLVQKSRQATGPHPFGAAYCGLLGSAFELSLLSLGLRSFLFLSGGAPSTAG